MASYHNRGPAVNMRRQQAAPLKKAPEKCEAPPETVSVSDVRCKKERYEKSNEVGASKGKSLIDGILDFLSPVFKKLLGRDANLEDVIILGVIILLAVEKLKSPEKQPFSLKNLTDNDFLLLALFYIFF